MRAKGCKIDWNSNNIVSISGMVDEYADFSDFASRADQIVSVNFSGVSRVNSSGLRSWIQTIKRHRIQLVLQECSPSIVEQFALIPEFIGNNGVVESFFVRYQCISCAFEENRRFQIGVNLSRESPRLDSKLSSACPDCGDVVELDHHTEIFLSFLMRLNSDSSSAS